ncbi:MAG: HIT domain-containing protein [Promethearchaeota archaeon]
MMKDDNCIFCKIVNNELPSKKVYEDQKFLAFLDIFPILEGHTIVIPKEHYMNIEDIEGTILSDLFILVKKISTHIHKSLKLEGYNILQNNFKAAGQVIDHIHIHIIPRKENDDRFKIKIPRTQAKDQDLNNVLKLIKM